MSTENQIHDGAIAEEERRPLIDSSILIVHQNGEDETIIPVPNQRLVSLDVFRGLTVALMILVDDVGRAFPSLNHSPWFGVTLADFVMPFFLFGVGVSIALVFKRISIGYFLASMSEIWLVNNNILVDSPAAFVRKYSIQWIFSILLGSVYLCLLYGLYVPNWKFGYSNLLWSGHVSTIQNVHCETRGSLDPPCNAVGFIDRLILGEDHMYQRPVYRRTKECSVNSPDYGPLPPDSPGWCLAPFDPEGILSSLMAAITCFVGLQFGHILVIFQAHKQRVLLWSVFSFSLLVVGYILEILGIPLSKALYTLSFMFITAGASGLVLTAIYYIVDIERLRKPTVLLQWMGMNALIVYALAACDIFPAIIQGFYWRSPENNLVDSSEALIQNVLHSEKWGTLAFVIIEILFWGLLAGFLHKKGIYIKL
ncbi:heparan-alpha-glucosaminide N-acetyltransferase-like protein [Trifolium pratense]|uniref:Heparan-alpha-glucosaminide N-acetyltransferase-like protein n=1 Tax=Trifolium pratense TaxID=57577 RepID=A0A2K3NVD7_TRIPR|nr:heparan-alpha-glucosaminide N-acetyltransferase-like protein [Trifolium pratense]